MSTLHRFGFLALCFLPALGCAAETSGSSVDSQAAAETATCSNTELSVEPRVVQALRQALGLEATPLYVKVEVRDPRDAALALLAGFGPATVQVRVGSVTLYPSGTSQYASLAEPASAILFEALYGARETRDQQGTGHGAIVTVTRASDDGLISCSAMSLHDQSFPIECRIDRVIAARSVEATPQTCVRR